MSKAPRLLGHLFGTKGITDSGLEIYPWIRWSDAEAAWTRLTVGFVLLLIKVIVTLFIVNSFAHGRETKTHQIMFLVLLTDSTQSCEPRHDKTNKMAVRPAKIQISLGMKKAWVLTYPLSAQRRLWSDWVDAQADLSLRWAHIHFVGFVMSRLMSLGHLCPGSHKNIKGPKTWLLYKHYAYCEVLSYKTMYIFVYVWFLEWVLFKPKGSRQIVQTQIRHHRTRCFIMVYNNCIQNFLLKKKKKKLAKRTVKPSLYFSHRLNKKIQSYLFYRNFLLDKKVSQRRSSNISSQHVQGFTFVDLFSAEVHTFE